VANKFFSTYDEDYEISWRNLLRAKKEKPIKGPRSKSNSYDYYSDECGECLDFTSEVIDKVDRGIKLIAIIDQMADYCTHNSCSFDIARLVSVGVMNYRRGMNVFEICTYSGLCEEE